MGYPKIFEAVSALNYDDADYDNKLREIVKDLEVISLENLTEAIPKQEELDKLVGVRTRQIKNKLREVTSLPQAEAEALFGAEEEDGEN